MAGFARWCFRHRRAVLAVWLIALIGFFGVSRLTGSAYSNSASLPGTDSAKALQVLTDGLPGPGRRQRPDRRAGQAGDAALCGRRDRGHVHARPGRPASRRALGDLSLRSGRPDQQGRHDRPGHGEPQRPGPEHPELGRPQADLHRQVRRQPAAERPARRGGDREHHVGRHELHQRAAGDRARAGRVVLRVPPLGARLRSYR